MRTVMLASVILVFVAGQTMAQSTVTVELELGGSNGDIGCSGLVGYDPPLFVQGTTADTEVYNAGHQVTWAGRIRATGVQQSGNGAGYACRGAANIVVDLELHEGSAAGPLADQYGPLFYSTANDGTGGCPNTSMAMAVGCRPYNGLRGNGRLIDYFQGLPVGYPGFDGGGVHMDVYTYANAVAIPGKLLGAGCGYHNWSRGEGGNLMTIAGVGQVAPDLGDPTGGCLGVGPFFEGQIDTTNLPAGTYVLVAKLGPGTNVLRGDVDLTKKLEAFATAADRYTGDGTIPVETITFQIIETGGANATAWRSVNYHGDRAVSDYLSVALDPSKVGPNDATSEPRAIGITLIEVDFDGQPGTHTPGQVILQGGLAQNGADSLVDNGDGTFTLVIPVTGTAPLTCYRIDISNSVTVLNDADCYVATCNGDGNDNRQTDALDRGAVKVAELAGALATANPRLDINTDGVIDALDRGAVKVRELALDKVTCP